ncbi:hypothetical protein [Streptomyces sp. NPDC002746]
MPEPPDVPESGATVTRTVFVFVTAGTGSGVAVTVSVTAGRGSAGTERACEAYAQRGGSGPHHQATPTGQER